MAVATTPKPAPVKAGTARVIPGDAAVTVHRGTPVAAADALLRSGDSLTVRSGVAGLRTAAGTLYALAGSSVLITDGLPRITRGDVLVQGNDVAVAMRAATAQINGLARVRQGLTLEVDVYRGGAVVRTATDTVGVQRLRRAMVLGNGGSFVTVAPLVINAADQWDRRFLGDALELDAALSARSRGLTMLADNDTNAVVAKVVDATGYKDLTLLPNEPVGEFVVAAELARAARLGRPAVDAALKLRSEGASWGLIALEQGVHALPTAIAGIDSVVIPAASSVVAAPAHVTEVTLPPAQTPAVDTTPTVSKPAEQPPAKNGGGATTVTTPVSVPPANTPGLLSGVNDLVGGLLGH